MYNFDMTTQDLELRFEVHFSKPIALTFEGESCEGNDGRINLDFGNQSINGNLQSWNYELRKDQQVLLNANESNLVAIEDLEPGAYEITFTWLGRKVKNQEIKNYIKPNFIYFSLKNFYYYISTEQSVYQ